eukprot:6214833-Pleurochrysis_carterae.AAC.6
MLESHLALPCSDDRVILPYRLDTAAPPNNRRGGAVYPLRLCGLRFVDGASGVASHSTLLSRSRYLLQSLAFSIAAGGRDDYGRA